MNSIGNLADVAANGSWLSNQSAIAARVPPVSSVKDQVELATIPSLAQAAQPEVNGPSHLAVLNDAVRTLRAAASQSTNPVETAYLLDLASRFEHLQEDEELSASSATA